MTVLALLAFAIELITPQIESTAYTVVMMESSRVVAGWRLYSVADRLFQADPLALTDPVGSLAGNEQTSAWSDSILTLVGPDTGGGYSVGIDPVPVGERRHFSPDDSIDRVVGVADIQPAMSRLYGMRTMFRDRGRTQAAVLGTIDGIDVRVVVNGALPLVHSGQTDSDGQDGGTSGSGPGETGTGETANAAETGPASQSGAPSRGGVATGDPTEMELGAVDSAFSGGETSIRISTVQIVPVPGEAWLVVAPDQSTAIVVMPETRRFPSRNSPAGNPATSR